MKKKLLYMWLCALMMCSMLLAGMNPAYAATKKLSSITAEYSGDELQKGDRIRSGDFKVTAYFNDGSTEDVSGSSRVDVSTTEVTKTTGEQKVTVSYTYDGTTKRDTAYVPVYRREISSIEADYNGSTLVVGGTISTDDVDVYVTYDNGDSEYVTGWYFGSYTLRKGTNSVRVYYEENDRRVSTTIDVEAVKGELQSITASYAGGTAQIGGTISRWNVTVTGYYTSDDYRGYFTAEIPSSWTLNAYTIYAGTNKLTVNYVENGKTFSADFYVTGTTTPSINQVSPSGTPSNPTGPVNGPVNSNVPGGNTPSAANGGKWVQLGTKWYFQNTNGTYRTHSFIQATNGSWYFVLKDGTMATDWIWVNNKWYYMDAATGVMKTGWYQVNNKWYFSNPDGAMLTGWIYIDGKYYFMNAGGDMAANTWIGNYYVNQDGVWTQTR